MIRGRKIHLGLRTDTTGYGGLCVLKIDVDGMANSISRTIDQPHLTAAAFGRSVGKRGQGWFERLSAAGHTPSTRVPRPKWGVMRTYVSQADQEVFHARFMTPSTMEKEAGADWRVIISKLNGAGIGPFAPKDENYDGLYLRSEVEGILDRCQKKQKHAQARFSIFDLKHKKSRQKSIRLRKKDIACAN